MRKGLKINYGKKTIKYSIISVMECIVLGG